MLAKILIIDDNPHISKLLTMNLEKEDFKVIHAGDGEEGLEKIATDKPDLVISDVMMPDGNGLEALPKISKTRPGLPVIIISAQNNIVTAIQAAEAEAARRAEEHRRWQEERQREEERRRRS